MERVPARKVRWLLLLMMMLMISWLWFTTPTATTRSEVDDLKFQPGGLQRACIVLHFVPSREVGTLRC